MTKEVIETVQVNEDTEVQLLLENGIYLLLIKSIGEPSEKTEPLTMNGNEEIAKEMLRLAGKIGLISKAHGLRTLMKIKILNEVFGATGTIVV